MFNAEKVENTGKQKITSRTIMISKLREKDHFPFECMPVAISLSVAIFYVYQYLNPHFYLNIYLDININAHVTTFVFTKKKKKRNRITLYTILCNLISFVNRML